LVFAEFLIIATWLGSASVANYLEKAGGIRRYQATRGGVLCSINAQSSTFVTLKTTIRLLNAPET
jgi:hypothetical protein